MKQAQSLTALVTGASGGIGRALAETLADEGHDLVLVARSEQKLQRLAADLKTRHDISARVIVQDLTEADAPQRIYDELAAADVTVDILVNNAGFASYGFFHELDLGRELGMIQLNVAALTHLTHLFLQGMVERGHGRILNVASTAAFQPGPLMAVYYATKAYVLHFSEALANELADKGVTVTALCPGPTDSGFQSRAEMEDSKLVQDGLMDAAAVARSGYEALMAGKTVETPGLSNKLGTLAPRFVPRNLVTRIVRQMQEQTDARNGTH